MPSGVVFVAILVIWAVILAPRAMKLYERTATQRTTKRFSSAMTILGSGKTEARVAVDTARRGSRVAVDTRAPGVALASGGVPSRSSAGVERSGTSPAVLRRRRVVATCAGTVILVAAAALLGAIPWFAVALAALPLVLFLGACAATAGSRRQPGTRHAAWAVEHLESVADGQTQPPSANAGTGPASVVVLSSRRARRSGLRAGLWTQARVLEAELAIAATYASAEEQLDLERYVASPSDVDGQPYLRAANE